MYSCMVKLEHPCALDPLYAHQGDYRIRTTVVLHKRSNTHYIRQRLKSALYIPCHASFSDPSPAPKEHTCISRLYWCKLYSTPPSVQKTHCMIPSQCLFLNICNQETNEGAGGAPLWSREMHPSWYDSLSYLLLYTCGLLRQRSEVG